MAQNNYIEEIRDRVKDPYFYYDNVSVAFSDIEYLLKQVDILVRLSQESSSDSSNKNDESHGFWPGSL